MHSIAGEYNLREQFYGGDCLLLGHLSNCSGQYYLTTTELTKKNSMQHNGQSLLTYYFISVPFFLSALYEKTWFYESIFTQRFDL